MGRVIAIGDIHGCYHTMKNLLSKVSYSSETDTLVFIGDYIDRGYYSYEVVSTLRRLRQQAGADKVICLRGNHEQMAIEAFTKGDRSLWHYNGGYSTEYSFDQHGEDIDSAIAWFKSLPLVYDTPQIIFCHAGLSYPKLEDNSEHDLLWGRNWIKTDSEEREKQVVFGHTPSSNNKAYVVDTGDICIDAACVYGGNLCALVIEEDGSSECVYVSKAKEDESV